MDYSSLQLNERIKGVLYDMDLGSDEEIVTFLEQYKYCSRDSLLQLLENSDTSRRKFANVDHATRLPIYKSVEMRYDVIVDVVTENAVVVYYNYFRDNTATMDLDPVFNTITITLMAVTPVNFFELAGSGMKPYAALEVFKRYLIEALDRKATDIHFDVSHHDDVVEYPVSLRISGDLVPISLIPINSTLNKQMISSLIAKKTAANELDLLDVSGVIASSSGIIGDDVELRISANKSRDGYHYVIRIQRKDTTSFTIDQLGFDPVVLKALRYVSTKRSGITLITGAIRTGKNTTAFAMANEMIKQPIKMVSYESPIEVLMPFTQVDYQESEEVLLNCVRLAKKQDVNIAFLNEIPNKEVAFAVQDLVNSSVHVITTMHMNRIWHLPYKLKEYYGDDYRDVLSQINAVFNQKMYAKACPYCSDTILVDAVKDDFVRAFLKERSFTHVSHNTGCISCNYTGRVLYSNQPYVEFIIFNDRIVSELLQCDAPHQMELVIKEHVKGQALEDFMCKGVNEGHLQYSALSTII